jgi:hypothetical protein
MVSFAPMLGINSRRLGRQESLATSSRLSLNRVSTLPAIGLMRSTELALNKPLVQTSKLLSTRIDRSHIGWDNWNPLAYDRDPSLDIESFNEDIDRSESRIARSDREGSFADDLSLNISNDLADRELKFFTKILTDEPIVIPDRARFDTIESIESRQQIAPNSVRSKSKSLAKSKAEKLPAKAKSKTSKRATLVKSPEILSEPIDRIQPAIVPNFESLEPVVSNDANESNTSETHPDISTIFIDSFIDNIAPPSISESFGDGGLVPSIVVRVASPLENPEPISPLSDNLTIADSLAESPLPRSIDSAPVNTLLSDDLSRTLPTPLQPELIQTSTKNLTTNPEVIALADPDPLLLAALSQLPDFDNPADSAVNPQPLTPPEPTAFSTTEPGIATTAFSEPPLQPLPNSDSATISPSPALNAGATIANEPGIDKTTKTDLTTVSPSPAIDTAVTATQEPGIDEINTPASSQQFPDTYLTTLSPAPTIEDTGATTINELLGIDDINIPEPHEVLQTSLLHNEPDIATKTTPEASLPNPTPALPIPNAANDEPIIDNIHIPAAPGAVLPAISPTNFTQLPSADPTSVSTNELDSETITTPEFTTLFISDDFSSSPFLEVDPELTPADNNEPEIDNPTIQTSPGIVPPDILPAISTQIPPVEPTSIPTNEPDIATTLPEFTTLLLSDIPTIPSTPHHPDADTSTERDEIGIKPTIPQSLDAVFTDISAPILPVEQNSIPASDSEIATTPTFAAISNPQPLNLPSVLPTEIPLSLDNIDIIRIDPEASIDRISTNSISQDDRIYPIAIDNETADSIDPRLDLSTDLSLTNFQIDRGNIADNIESNTDRQLDVNEPILPNTNLAESLLNIVPQTEIETPTPVRGYATGGHVKTADRAKEESIASSDTVAAMLTPGEFVINAKDAQKNLNLLTHLNSGGEAETIARSILPELPIESSQTGLKAPTPLIQHKHRDPLISTSLQPDIDRHQISLLNRSPLDNFEPNRTESERSTSNYISPSLIFRKPQSTSQSDFSRFDPPDEWNSIEELMNGGSYGSEPFGFSPDGAQDFNNDRSISSSSTPNLAPKYSSPVMGFANGGEVPLTDINPKIEPITQTIEAKIPDEGGSGNSNSAELETLAREIYYRLRQRLEIERERQGIYSGNLPW